MVPTWSLNGPSMVLISIHLLDMFKRLSKASLENLRALASLGLAQISCARMVGLGWLGWVGWVGLHFEINDCSALAEPIN